MRTLGLILTGLAPVLCVVMPAWAELQPTTLSFAVTRNGERIGTSTVRVRHDGDELVADVDSRVEVKIAFVTVYRFEQSETERWRDGQLVAMTAATDDNGTPHRVSAARSGGKLLVNADGKTSELDPGLMPVSPWNAALVRKTMALDIKSGHVIPVSVIDRGEEQLTLRGRRLTAHHYSIRTSFPQDVWYDQNRRLVQVELSGSDGSTIRYQPG